MITDILYLQRMLLMNPAAARLFFAHQRAKHLVGFEGVFQVGLLSSVRLAGSSVVSHSSGSISPQAFEAGDGQTAPADLADFTHQVAEVRSRACCRISRTSCGAMTGTAPATDHAAQLNSCSVPDRG